MKIYLIGSLRNPKIVDIANILTEAGFDTFADWAAAGEAADNSWRDYSKARGWNYKQALQSHAAQHIFAFDKKHLMAADVAVLAMPAGKSAHLELGFHLGLGKRGYILFDEEPERFDVMTNFATDIFFSVEALIAELRRKI